VSDLPAEHDASQPTGGVAEPQAPTGPATPVVEPLDLDRIEADLADVEIALARLDSGEYWRDEVTGAELADGVLEADPVTRRAPSV
jgi:hypothetical protein